MASMSDTPEIKQEFQPVLCDMCLDKQTPALKTCLKCEISMCAQHLQAHLTTPVLLQTHPLTKPTAPGGLSSGAVRCPEHGKLLEYYCLDDRTCVCVSCSIEDQHRLHNMKTLLSAHKVLVEKLREEMKELAEREKEGKALKNWETEQTKALETSTKCLKKGVLELRNTGLTKVQSSVVSRLGTIKTARQNIETALSEEDVHLFLQRYAEVHEAVEKARAVDFIHGLEEEAEPGEVVFNLLKYGNQIMKKVRKLQRDTLVLVDPDKEYWGRNESTDLTFDPQTTGQYFVLSSDLKVLSCRSPGDLSQRVYLQNSIKGDLYWIIHFSERYDWCVGIGAKNLPKASSGDRLCGPLYGLEWKNKQFSELYTETNTDQSSNFGHRQGEFNLIANVLDDLPELSSTSHSIQNKIEVQWDSSSRSLSFWNTDDYDEIICIHSVDVDSSVSHELFPFVTVEEREKDPPNRSGTSLHKYSGCSRCSNSPYVNFVCALDDENEFGPPIKKRKLM